MYFAIKPYLGEFDVNEEKVRIIFKSLNNMLIFMGLGISFATLQDTNKTSLRLEKKIWANPKKGKLLIIIILLSTLLALVFGVFGYFISKNENLKELSIGTIVFGIGLLGVLKTAIEVFDSHRKDK
jgi:O-antigen/teichoic acid export membrane protein